MVAAFVAGVERGALTWVRPLACLAERLGGIVNVDRVEQGVVVQTDDCC